MMTQEQNDELTRVGPGTPMGEVLRHYWYPVCFERELDEFPVKKVRLLGEDFAVFKMPTASTASSTRSARTAARRSCTASSRRRPALRLSRLEVRHRREVRRHPRRTRLVADVPRATVCVKAGEAQKLGGHDLGLRLGEARPELPRYEAYVMDGVRDVGHSVLPCNWLQIMENSVDPYHVEALHGNYFAFIAEWSRASRCPRRSRTST
jgi:5,5'-dehydrodivanillate O-demethylase oxygenase subunit